jgi:eukaryotic-like serine/threonine-protein kinase
MPKPGELLGGRYRLDDRIAAGGMGEVWAATDTVLSRPVAVKMLLGGRGTDPGFLSRFRHEARTMAALRHPGVVQVYDFGDTEDDGAYLVMARVGGQPLNRVIADRGQLSVAETMSIVAQAGRALQAAHEAGVIHRDVKPGNLIIEPDGTVVLVDFGVARSANSVTLTGAREVVGTALYIAPEQVSKQATGPAADLYALGAVAYHCLTGRPPFLGDNPLAVALQHVTDEPPPLSRDVPRPVRDLVGIALAKQPEERFPSAAAMAAAAEAAVAGSVPSATLTSLTAATGALAATGAMTATAATSGGLTVTGAGSAIPRGDQASFGLAPRTGGTGPEEVTGVDPDAATQKVAAGAFAGRAMVGAPRFDDVPPAGPVQDGRTMADGSLPAVVSPGTADPGPAGPPAVTPGGGAGTRSGPDRGRRTLIAVAAAVLVLLGLGAAFALTDPLDLFGDDPTGGTTPATNPSAAATKDPAPKSTGKGNSGNDRPQQSVTSSTPKARTTSPAAGARPTGDATTPTTEPTTEPAEQPTTAAPTQTQTTGDDDEGNTGGDKGNSGNGGNNEGSGNGGNNGGSGGGGEDDEATGANALDGTAS